VSAPGESWPSPRESDDVDRRFMQAALSYGRRGMGVTAPNPSVGALVVRDGMIVGAGATQPGGRPHAEIVALREAGEAARGATLYVTLEPCSHHGKSPPCADAVVASGVARVVSAMEDPDLRVAGRGHARLRAAGVEVSVGCLGAQARRAHRGHILRQTEGRPEVVLKLAETSDGYAAAGENDPRLMITGQAANLRVHMMRAMSDAIMVGVGTAKADDPLMTVRLPGMEDRRPLRVVLDGRLETPLRSRLGATARSCPTVAIATLAAPLGREAALREAGVEVVRVEGRDGRPDLSAALRWLAARGVTRVMSEGGPTIASALIAAGLADEVAIFTNPKPLAREGVPALDAGARIRLANPCAFSLIESARVGHDLLRRYEKV
jgi:diaminohydroxyphosphoribosylaminopyrimidine deaminase/5-amino-6-(5-phosphoribosylamino)uracil reductase